jgi:hypothetical protein
VKQRSRRIRRQNRATRSSGEGTDSKEESTSSLALSASLVSAHPAIHCVGDRMPSQALQKFSLTIASWNVNSLRVRMTADLVRIQNRLKALNRSRGVSTSGSAVYSQTHRDAHMGQLPASCRPSAMLLYAQSDAVQQVKKDADKQLIECSHKHAIARTLETCLGLGPIAPSSHSRLRVVHARRLRLPRP